MPLINPSGGGGVPTGTASGTNAVAISAGTIASANYSFALGLNSAGTASKAVTGAGAMALGGSYASGQDSFAAANADNSGTYGAQGANAVAIGKQTKATGIAAFAFGNSSTASGTNSFSFGSGGSNTASGDYSVSFGGLSSGHRSFAMGVNSSTGGLFGKYVFCSGSFSSNGDAQLGTLVVRISTADATAAVMTSDQGAATTSNQVILQNNQAMTFNALITARENATGDTAAWQVSGCIKRGTGVAATTLLGSAASTTWSDTGAATWTAVVSADTTNGGLKITVTGQAAKTIRWSATVSTNELAG